MTFALHQCLSVYSFDRPDVVIWISNDGCHLTDSFHSLIILRQWPRSKYCLANNFIHHGRRTCESLYFVDLHYISVPMKLQRKQWKLDLQAVVLTETYSACQKNSQKFRIENGWRTKSIVTLSRGILVGFTRIPFSTAVSFGDNDKFRCTLTGNLILVPYLFLSKHWSHKLGKLHWSKSCFSSIIYLLFSASSTFPL